MNDETNHINDNVQDAPKRLLYHYPLSPFSRKVRILMSEKRLEFELQIERYWQRRREFIALNPESQVPVLRDVDGTVVADSNALCEYLEEVYPEPSMLLGDDPKTRAEVRRIASWFNNKFYYEVTKYILDEKLLKFLKRSGEPNMAMIRAGQKNILYHLDYIGHLTRSHTWLAGNRFSLADINAAAQLSVLDYLNVVPWEHNRRAKEWYALVKSRPSFRAIMEDRISAFKPPAYYDNPDF